MEHVLSLWCGCMGFDATGVIRCHPVITCILHKSHTESQQSHGGMIWMIYFLFAGVWHCCSMSCCAASLFVRQVTWNLNELGFALGITSVWPHHQFLSPCWNLSVWPAFVLHCATLSVSRRCLVSSLICPCLLFLVFRTQSAVKNRAAKVR